MKKKAPEQINRILVPTDFSPYSRHAASYACMLAQQFCAEITLMHVIEPPVLSVSDTSHVLEYRRALERIAERRLQGLCAEMRKKGFRVRPYVVIGRPYHEILKQAKQISANLIVMGTHGRTGMEHLLLGSVAEKIVRLSQCPVLTVRLTPHRRTLKSRKG